MLAVGMIWILLLIFGITRGSNLSLRRLAFGGAFATVTLFLVLCTEGCGGGGSSLAASQVPQPAPIVTPQGTFTIIVTPSAPSASGQALTLQPIQLTLTVQ
jgi:hypothetical protein